MRRVIRGVVSIAVVLASASVLVGVESADEAAVAHAVTRTSGVHGQAAVDVSVYAAVVRQVVRTASDARPGVVYLIKATVEGAADPTVVDTQPKPFRPGVEAGLRKELRDLPPLRFVKARSSVINQDPGASVIHNGVLVTLGPIVASTKGVEVGVSSYLGNMGGRWSTYRLERHKGHWVVTGTTGPQAIS